MCLAPQPQASTPHTGKTPSCGMLLRLPMGIAQQIPNATNYCSRKVLPSAWSNADQGKQKKLVLSAAGESNSASTQESSFGPKKNVACHLCSLYCGKQSCIDLAQALGENALANLTQDLWHQGLFWAQIQVKYAPDHWQLKLLPSQVLILLMQARCENDIKWLSG